MSQIIRYAAATIVCVCFLVSFTVGQDQSVTSRPATAPPDAPSGSGGAPLSTASTQPTTQPTTRPATQPAAQPSKPTELAVAFKDMGVEQVADFLAKQYDKPVLPTEEAKKKKITVVCKKKLPAADALRLVRQALLDAGLMIEKTPSFLRIRPVSELLQTDVPRVGPETRASELDDPLEIVAKTFIIRHYDVGKLLTVVAPMKSSFAHILADPDTRKLVVTDTAASLARVEQVIDGMDTPQAEATLTQIVKLDHGDASEIISIVRWLIAGKMGVNVKDITTLGAGKSSGRSSSPSMPRGMSPQMRARMGGRSGSSSRSSGSSRSGGEAVTQIDPATTPVTLVPHVSRNWIIAVAPAKFMDQIVEWIEQLDKPREVERDYELYDVEYADVDDVARQIDRTISQMPNTELRDATHVVPFGQSKKIIVFGSKTGRQMVKDLLSRLDVEDAEKQTRKTFILKHADAEEMAERIDSLFSGLEVSYKSSWGTSYRRDRESAKVTVVADIRRNAVTVLTNPKTMVEIADLIAEEDRPIDPGDVMPRVYELKYIDPSEAEQVLSEMFGAKEDKQRSFWDMYYGSGSDRKSKPVGRLLGQFTFQVLPSSGRLLVNAKSADYYHIIDEVVEKLDQPQRAGLPEIVELNHANAEDLCEQLNAILAEPGTLAKIRRAERGLLEYRRQNTAVNSNVQTNSSSNAANSQEAKADEMAFWWQSFKRPEGQVPASNLVGKIRIVPVYRRNAVMLLAPEGCREPVMELIEEMDRPGQQVLIHARVGEIEHDGQTTLGLRIATDPALLNAGDTAIGGNAAMNYLGVFGSTLTLDTNASFFAILNLLIQEFDMKVLLEPTLTTSDNEAAQYFDGQDVPTQTQSRESAEGTTTVTDIVYRAVGTLLRVRPHITIEGNVDLMVNLEISRILPGAELFGNPTIDRREVTTHVVVQDGQTIMLSGIIRKEIFDEVRKVPLLGDIPGIGKIFRSIDKGVRNRELVVFLTPHVMSDPDEVDAQMEGPLETLERATEQVSAVIPDNPVSARALANRSAKTEESAAPAVETAAGEAKK